MRSQLGGACYGTVMFRTIHRGVLNICTYASSVVLPTAAILGFFSSYLSYYDDDDDDAQELKIGTYPRRAWTKDHCSLNIEGPHRQKGSNELYDSDETG